MNRFTKGHISECLSELRFDGICIKSVLVSIAIRRTGSICFFDIDESCEGMQLHFLCSQAWVTAKNETFRISRGYRCSSM